MNDQEIGQLGAKWAAECDWDGVDILTLAQEALTQANFHSEAAVIEQMIAALLEHNEVVYHLETEARP